MNDLAPDLRRYEGRYQIGTFVLRRSLIERFLTVRVAGDHLEIERSSGETHPLVRSSDHRFDAVDGSRGFRFVLGSDGIAKSLIVIRDGTPSEPGPRLVPLPQPVEGRREAMRPIDLGHICLCMQTADTEKAIAFYQRLGFRTTDAQNMLEQGFTIIPFMDWLRVPCLNFRGPSILATGSELAKRGYELMGLDTEGEQVRRDHLQNDEAGFFSVYDPDGHHLFFNTHLDERMSYDAWKEGEAAQGVSQQRTEVDVPVQLELGDLVVCLEVTDLPTSVSFYRGMGFAVIGEAEDTATLFAAPARRNPHAFPLRLRQAKTPRFTFGFHCSDVEGVRASIEALGIEMVSTPDGPAFTDPDGNRVALLSASPPLP